jgi:PAS domain S-box-containing protein
MMNARENEDENLKNEFFLKGFQLLNPRERLLLQKKSELKERFSKGNFNKLLEELQTSQVELEFQNEELQKAKMELELSRNKYADLFNSSPIGYFIFDKDGFISDVNIAATKMLHISKDFLLNKMFHVYIHPDSWDVFNEFFQKVMEDENLKQPSCEITMLNKDKEIFFAHIEGLQVIENGIKQCRIAVIDISERKLAEEALIKNSKELLFSKQQFEKKSRELAQVFVQLAKSERDLRDLNQNKNKFFTIISHDLRNPFSVLMGLSDILKREGSEMDQTQIQEISNMLYSNVQNINVLLNNLLEWSRIQFEKVNFQPEKLDLNDCVSKISRLIKPYADNKKIKIKNCIESNLMVYADKNMLDSVLQNLLTNSIKFTNEKGDISVIAEEKDRFIQITVADTGVGFDAQLLNKLFKVGNYSKRGTANEIGSGIGLVLCKELVEIHGGKIRAEAEQGSGSRFIFTLPNYPLQNLKNNIKKVKPDSNLSAA